MNDFPLSIMAGDRARQELSENGWSPGMFSTVVGASGGAKMLGLVHLDRFVFGDFLQRSDHPVELYGSSIGSWRHAAVAAPDPLAALVELQDRYHHQRWDENDTRSPGEIVDELCDWVIDGFCTETVKSYICKNSRFTTHIVTARGRGLNGRGRSLSLGAGMGLAAIGNAINRQLLASSFQRVVFSTGPSRAFAFNDFDTVHVPLTTDNIRAALLASGSIPFLMSGQRDIPGSPKGQYWDGGIIDYHFDFENCDSQGLVLYPHFSEHVVKGWFDKTLPWRRNKSDVLDRVVLLAPSQSYLNRLPQKKIPDRGDFRRMSQADRKDYWGKAVDASQELADAFAEVVEDTDPLRHVKSHP
jgi:hypothetical protein